MTGSFWWDLLIGVGLGLLTIWVALLVVLVIVRPRGGMLREALRLLPDVLRLIRRLAGDTDLPRGGACPAGPAAGLPRAADRPGA